MAKSMQNYQSKNTTRKYQLLGKKVASWLIFGFPAILAALILTLQFFPDGPPLLVGLSNEIFKEIEQHPVKITLAFFALIYFYHEIRLRRKLLEQEIDIKQKQLSIESADREARSQWLSEQVGQISQLSKEISKNISEELNRNTDWAYEALEEAKLGIFSKTLFGMRKGDFSDEKEFIAKSFSPYLLGRIQKYAEDDKCDIYLIIESGTTVYPFFENIAKAVTFQYVKGKTWAKKHLTIITNNLPGVESLTESGRVFPENRYSDIALKCKIFTWNSSSSFLWCSWKGNK